MANSAGFSVIEMIEAATTSWKPFAGMRSKVSDVVATMNENSPICANPAPIINEEEAKKFIAWGYTFIAVGADLGLLAKNADALAKRFKS